MPPKKATASSGAGKSKSSKKVRTAGKANTPAPTGPRSLEGAANRVPKQVTLVKSQKAVYINARDRLKNVVNIVNSIREKTSLLKDLYTQMGAMCQQEDRRVLESVEIMREIRKLLQEEFNPKHNGEALEMLLNIKYLSAANSGAIQQEYNEWKNNGMDQFINEIFKGVIEQEGHFRNLLAEYERQMGSNDSKVKEAKQALAAWTAAMELRQKALQKFENSVQELINETNVKDEELLKSVKELKDTLRQKRTGENATRKIREKLRSRVDNLGEFRGKFKTKYTGIEIQWQELTDTSDIPVDIANKFDDLGSIMNFMKTTKLVYELSPVDNITREELISLAQKHLHVNEDQNFVSIKHFLNVLMTPWKKVSGEWTSVATKENRTHHRFKRLYDLFNFDSHTWEESKGSYRYAIDTYNSSLESLKDLKDIKLGVLRLTGNVQPVGMNTWLPVVYMMLLWHAALKAAQKIVGSSIEINQSNFPYTQAMNWVTQYYAKNNETGRMSRMDKLPAAPEALLFGTSRFILIPDNSESLNTLLKQITVNNEQHQQVICDKLRKSGIVIFNEQANKKIAFRSNRKLKVYPPLGNVPCSKPDFT